MKAFKITETGNFMTKLLSGDSFDLFLLEEASLRMQGTWTFDGHVNRSFYTDEEWENSPILQAGFVSWAETRGHMRELIRGKKAPASLSIVLQLPRGSMEKLLADSGLAGLADNIGAMVLNIRYDGSLVMLVTGISLKNFTLDQNASSLWDDYVQKFLASHKIAFEPA